MRLILPDALGDGVHVPDDGGAGLKVVGPLGSHLLLGRVAVIALAPDFDGERRRALDELHGIVRERTHVKGSVRGKGLPSRRKFGYAESHTVGVGNTPTCCLGVVVKAAGNSECNPVWKVPRRHLVDDTPADKLG